MPTYTDGRGFVSEKDAEKLARLFLRHVRKVEGLASLRQRAPGIPQAFIMFAFLGIVCFLRQRCTAGGRFPRGFALGSHLFNCLAEPRSATMRQHVDDGAALAAPSPSAT
jgi:hypothetical protein